ncbi:MAG: DsbA family protein, partial [Ectothiorhodospiraceae bacterium]
EEAERILAGVDYAEQVRTEETRYKQAGITGVPAFILNQKYLIQGAQEPDTLVTALREAPDAQVATA